MAMSTTELRTTELMSPENASAIFSGSLLRRALGATHCLTDRCTVALVKPPGTMKGRYLMEGADRIG